VEELFVLGDVTARATLANVAKYLRQAEQLAIEASESSQLGNLLDYVEGLTPIPPGSTETRQEIQARLGQGKFRDRVLKRWGGACAISGIRNRDVIRASHIQPWKKCETEDDRLKPENGLPLIPNYDTLFDCGLICFTDTGKILVSRKLSASERRKLGLPARLSRELRGEECRFMQFHREKVFCS
jgi:predicted restriction endonuclease